MAKGNIAKENLMKMFINAPGIKYCGESDKKYYFWSEENGEPIQIAVSMTCPKTPVEFGNVPTPEGGTSNFEDAPAPAKAAEVKAKMSEDEQATLARLMEELGL